ncbi:histone methylation protein DOT1-domain-containing protein, partial [Blyttiomyces helicus]
EAVRTFNKLIIDLREDGAFERAETEGPAAQYPLIAHVLEQSYARAVALSAHLLNSYEGFSNNVYGEVKHVLVNDIIKNANIKPHHVFLDMGSGIGSVVLQIAAQCLCEAHGIEIMENPAQLAKAQRAEFLSRMRWVRLRVRVCVGARER